MLAAWNLFSAEVFIYLNSVLLRDTPKNICSIHGGFGEEQIPTLTSKYFHSIETERKESTSRKMANCMENNCGPLWALTRLLNILPFLKHAAKGISLVVLWLRLCLPMQAEPIWYLAGELHASWSKNQNIK